MTPERRAEIEAAPEMAAAKAEYLRLKNTPAGQAFLKRLVLEFIEAETEAQLADAEATP